MERALMERDSVLMVSEAKDSSINEFIETLNAIELNLDSITQAQNAISMDTKDEIEFNQDIRDRISANISVIGSLLEENQNKITDLEEKLKRSNINLSSLRKQVQRLKSDIEMKDAEISELNQRLVELKLVVDSLNTSVDSLNVQNAGKDKIISEQTSKTRTGVPYLNRIPGLGLLFGSVTDTTSRSETIVMITPTVIENTADLKAVSDDIRTEFRKVPPINHATLQGED